MFVSVSLIESVSFILDFSVSASVLSVIASAFVNVCVFVCECEFHCECLSVNVNVCVSRRVMLGAGQ